LHEFSQLTGSLLTIRAHLVMVLSSTKQEALMSFNRCLSVAVLAASWLLLPSTARATPILGQVNNFEDGTTQGWLINLLNMSPPPAEALPVNVPTGGPAGAEDNYLRLTSVGGNGPGGRLVALNLTPLWTGNYLTSGVNAISMDVNNVGTTDLSLRLYLENPMMGPPTDEAITSAVFLAAGSGWRPVTFLIDPANLIVLSGNATTLLSNVTSLRIYNGPTASFPGPGVPAQLGVDNIGATAVPEPASMLLLGIGLAGIGMTKRRS
jgi:hypothetical protein